MATPQNKSEPAIVSATPGNTPESESIYLAPLILPESYKICEFIGAKLYVRFLEKKILPVADPGEGPGGRPPPPYF